MKLFNAKEIDDYKSHILMAGLRGGALGGIVSAGMWQFWLRKKTFMNAGGFIRTLTIAAPVLLFGITNMEIAGRDFEIAQNYSESSERAALLAEGEGDQSFAGWAKANKYKLVASGWAASMVGSYVVVNRNKYMTKAQKIVQARVYAQGLTVIMLLATVFMSAGKESTRKITPEQQEDSWKTDLQFVEQEHK